MIEKSDAHNCAIFQAQLPELIGSGEGAGGHLHLQNCTNCRALISDLQSIADAARRLFPVEDPPDELWEEIQMAIDEERADAHPG